MRERDGHRATVARFDASRLGLARMRSVASEAPPETDWGQGPLRWPVVVLPRPRGAETSAQAYRGYEDAATGKVMRLESDDQIDAFLADL